MLTTKTDTKNKNERCSRWKHQSAWIRQNGRARISNRFNVDLSLRYQAFQRRTTHEFGNRDLRSRLISLFQWLWFGKPSMHSNIFYRSLHATKLWKWSRTVAFLQIWSNSLLCRQFPKHNPQRFRASWHWVLCNVHNIQWLCTQLNGGSTHWE